MSRRVSTVSSWAVSGTTAESARAYSSCGSTEAPATASTYGRDGEDFVVLLAGGTKKRQTHDIQTAHAIWKAYRQEKRHARQSP